MYPAVCPAFFIGNEQEMAEKKLIWSECKSSRKKRGANEKVVFQLINTEQNRSFLEQVPHREFQDLSIIYKLVINADAESIQEELAIAKSVDLCAVAESLGYTVKKIGKYHTLKEMDSIRIYDRSHWYRWSRQFDKGNNGGSQIDFLRVFGRMSVKEAVFWLLDFAGYRRIESMGKQPLVHQVTKKQPQERKPFVLPQPAGDNSYLIFGL